jgi:hypothetical protein
MPVRRAVGLLAIDRTVEAYLSLAIVLLLTQPGISMATLHLKTSPPSRAGPEGIFGVMLSPQDSRASFLFRTMSKINVHNGYFNPFLSASDLAEVALPSRCPVLKLGSSTSLGYGDVYCSARQAQGSRCVDL